ncbi:hypothetical protein U1Q18_025416, partial [Sarracenia purpurea var. burkii]
DSWLPTSPMPQWTKTPGTAANTGLAKTSTYAGFGLDTSEINYDISVKSWVVCDRAAQRGIVRDLSKQS